MAIDTAISPYISSQFPRLYREEGPQFIAFLKLYYEWMEQEGNVLYESRNLIPYRDIDQTLDEFIVYFKNKYMVGIPDSVLGDKRTLQKHIKEIYSSKGSIRGLQLLFRLLLNESADLYLPGDDILKPSDGLWTQPIYLEVSANPNNVLLVGETITGRESGATAIVEDFQVRYINRRQINILYISQVRGQFTTGEILLNDIISETLRSPHVLGSMTNIQINESGFGYAVGDVLDVIGGAGILGKAVVSAISPRNGSIVFSITDGGKGYSNSSVSGGQYAPNQITVEAVSNTNPGIGATFEVGDLDDTEVLEVVVIDVISPYANTTLDATDYDFPSIGTTDINSTLGSAFQLEDITVGTILTLRGINPGAGYNGPVVVTVVNSLVKGLHLDDGNGGIKGDDAVVGGQASAGEGAIDEVKLLDSGLGYEEGDEVELQNADNPTVAGGFVRLGHEGRSQGFWKDTRSFLNADKYVQDSFYYQEYSYEVRVAQAFERYADILQKLWHPAGTQGFGKVVVASELDNESAIEEVDIAAIFLTTYVTSFATAVETTRSTTTAFGTLVPTTYLTQKATSTSRSTSTNILNFLAERMINGSFNSDLSNWTTAAGTATWVSNQMQLDASTRVYQAFSSTVGRTYYVQLDVDDNPSGASVTAKASNSSAGTSPIGSVATTSTGHKVFSFVATATVTYIHVETDAAGVVLVDNISTKELPDTTVHTAYDTNRATSTGVDTNRATDRTTATVFDTNRATTFSTSKLTLSVYLTNRSTQKSTSSVYDTLFDTSILTAKNTDTNRSTQVATGQDTTTAYVTSFSTAFGTNRNTTTTGATSFATNRSTTGARATVIATDIVTNRLTDTLFNTIVATNILTSTNKNTAYNTAYDTVFQTGTTADTIFATNFDTVYDTVFDTVFVSQYTTTFNTSKNTATSKNTSTNRTTQAVTNTTYLTFYTVATRIGGGKFTSYFTNTEYQKSTVRSTTTGAPKNTVFNTSTVFNTTTAFNTSAITSVNTNRSTNKSTTRNTVFDTNRSTGAFASTNRDTNRDTTINTVFDTLSVFNTGYDTSFATLTQFVTTGSTSKDTTTAQLTTFDTTIATDKVTVTGYDTIVATNRATDRATNTQVATVIDTAFATSTQVATAYQTNRSTAKATLSTYDTVFNTNASQATEIDTSRVTVYATNLATTTAFVTMFDTVIATGTTYDTARDTVFVQIPTTFQTTFDTNTTAETDYQTTIGTDALTDTTYDTDYGTSFVTSLNTQTDLL
jgi:hypothetical protein